jgi:hypothetical protein
LTILFASVVAFVGGAQADGNFALIEGQGERVPAGDVDPCPTSPLTHHHDGSTEAGFTWGWPGVHEPDYGALAEDCPGPANGIVCGIELNPSHSCEADV